MIKRAQTFLLAVLIFSVYTLLRMTWRVRIVEHPDFRKALDGNQPLVLAHWHGDEMVIIHLLRRYRAAVMVSTSKDGDLMKWLAEFSGAKTSRGSSTRGGAAALKGIIRLSRAGRRPSIAVDGPKGPYHKAKPGVFEISKLTGGEIAPISAVCDRAHIFERAWNKSFLPLPFARVSIVWGKPLAAISRDQDSRDPKLAEILESALSDAGQQARNLIAGS